jgi:hypothetical protein
MTPTTVSRAEQAAHIMEHFEFARVAQAMKKLNWTWCDTAPNTPSVDQLKVLARRHLDYLIDNPKMTGSSSGGLYASVDAWGHLYLAFVVADWDACDYCHAKDGNLNY